MHDPIIQMICPHCGNDLRVCLHAGYAVFCTGCEREVWVPEHLRPAGSRSTSSTSIPIIPRLRPLYVDPPPASGLSLRASCALVIAALLAALAVVCLLIRAFRD